MYSKSLIPKWLEPIERSAVSRYSAAILLVLVATVARSTFSQPLQNFVYFTFFPTIAVAGWFGGFGPGMLATILSAAAVRYFFFELPGNPPLSDGQLISLLLFIGFGAIMSLLNEVLHHLVQRERGLRDEFEVTLSSIGD